MANTRALITDPLRSFKFNAVIPQVLSGANTAGESRFGFMSVSGLGISIEPLTYREGGDNLTALPLDSPVLTVNGWKAMGDIEIGDRLIDPKGEESKVIDILPAGMKDTYEVTLGDGSKAEACFGHLWEYETIDTNNTRKTVIGTTLDMKAYIDRSGGYRVLLPKMLPMQFDVAPELPLDPYLLGVLLSEGSLEMDGVSFAQEECNIEVIDRVRDALPLGHSLRPEYQGGVLRSWAITVGNDGPGARNVFPGRNQVVNSIRDLGLLGHRAWEKFVPEDYKLATIADRLALLQGIMDGDGWVDEKHSTQFSSTSEQLTKDVRWLISSLGGRCGKLVHTTNRTYIYKGERCEARDTYSFAGVSDLDCMLFTLPRKVERFRCSTKSSSQFRRVRAVELIGKREVQCIEVSASSHLFISHDFVPSHNTRKMPGQADFNPITLSRGLFATDFDNWYWMTTLFTAMYGGGTNSIVGANPSNDFRTVMYINVLDHPNNGAQNTASQYGATFPNQANIVKVSVKLYSAWITSLAYSDLDAGGNAVAVEQMTLNYEGFEMQWGGQNASGFVQNPTSW